MAAKSLAEDFFPSFGRAVDFFPSAGEVWSRLHLLGFQWVQVSPTKIAGRASLGVD